MQHYFATVEREKEVLLNAQWNAFRSDAAFKKEYRENKAKEYLKIQAVFQEGRPTNSQ